MRFRLKRGNDQKHQEYNSSLGEITYNTDKKTAVVHDGVTTGGTPLVRYDDERLLNNVKNSTAINGYALDSDINLKFSDLFEIPDTLEGYGIHDALRLNSNDKIDDMYISHIDFNYINIYNNFKSLLQKSHDNNLYIVKDTQNFYIKNDIKNGTFINESDGNINIIIENNISLFDTLVENNITEIETLTISFNDLIEDIKVVPETNCWEDNNQKTIMENGGLFISYIIDQEAVDVYEDDDDSIKYYWKITINKDSDIYNTLYYDLDLAIDFSTEDLVFSSLTSGDITSYEQNSQYKIYNKLNYSKNAFKLYNKMKLNLTGDIIGDISFDGSEDVDLNTNLNIPADENSFMIYKSNKWQGSNVLDFGEL